jgi:hypothetical protein
VCPFSEVYRPRHRRNRPVLMRRGWCVCRCARDGGNHSTCCTSAPARRSSDLGFSSAAPWLVYNLGADEIHDGARLSLPNAFVVYQVRVSGHPTSSYCSTTPCFTGRPARPAALTYCRGVCTWQDEIEAAIPADAFVVYQACAPKNYCLCYVSQCFINCSYIWSRFVQTVLIIHWCGHPCRCIEPVRFLHHVRFH